MLDRYSGPKDIKRSEFFTKLPSDLSEYRTEETLIQGLVIAEIKDLKLQQKFFEKWVNKIDNWSTCDTVVSTLKGLKNLQ